MQARKLNEPVGFLVKQVKSNIIKIILFIILYNAYAVDHQQWKYEERGARKQKVIDNEEISNLTPGHLRKLHTLELRYSVQLTVEKEVERIVIDGQYEDVLQVFGEILELLHEVEKDKHERNHAEMLSKDIQWKYEEDGTFEDYDGNLNAQIELAFQKDKSKIEIQMDEENYTVKFDTMTMEDEGGMIATNVKRIDLHKGTMTACALSLSLNNFRCLLSKFLTSLWYVFLLVLYITFMDSIPFGSETGYAA